MTEALKLRKEMLDAFDSSLDALAEDCKEVAGLVDDMTTLECHLTQEVWAAYQALRARILNYRCYFLDRMDEELVEANEDA